MTSVNQKSFAEPMIAFEDGASVPAETKCAGEVAAKAATPEQTKGGGADSFETVSADPRREELARINAERKALRPELEKKETEALRSLPKMIPYAGTLADVAFGIWDAAKAVKKGDVVDAAKAAGGAGKAMLETKAFNTIGEKAVDKFGEGAGEGVEAVARFKDAYEVYRAMREYGKVARQDDDLRYRAEDLEMQLDPNKKFELVKVNGKNFYRQDGKLFADKPAAKPTRVEQELCERLAKGK